MAASHYSRVAIISILLLFFTSLHASEDKVLLQLRLAPDMTWEETFDVQLEVRTDEESMRLTRESLQALLDQMPEAESPEQQAQIDMVKKYLSDATSDKPYMSLQMLGTRENTVQGGAPDEGYTLSSVMRRIRIAMEGFMMPPTLLDSETEALSGSGLDAILLMLDERLTLKIDTDGQVTGVEGIEQIVDKAAALYGDNPALRAQVTELIQEQQKEYAMQDLAPYPSHAVGINDSWIIDLPVQVSDAGGAESPSTLPVRMTLNRRENGQAFITGQGEIIVDTETNSFGLGSHDATTSKVPVTLKMELVVDEASGLPLKMLMEMHSHMEIPAEQGSQNQQFDSMMRIKLSNKLL